MTKNQLITSIARQTGISKTDTKMTVEMLITTVKRVISSGGFIHLRKFGSFGIKNRKAKVGRDIRRKVTVSIPPKKVVCFKPSSHFFD